MKAYIMDAQRKQLVCEMPDPTCSGDNTVIKIHYASICGTDIRIHAKGDDKIVAPRILGHECVGTLVNVGTSAAEQGFQCGDRVVVEPAIGCGACIPCAKHHENMCNDLKTIGWHYDGTFAEYLQVPPQAIKMHNLCRVPKGVSDISATLAEPAACVLNAQTYLNIQPHDNVIIYGGGFIGCVHAELAHIQEAGKIIIVEISPERSKLIKQMLPYVEVIDPTHQNTVDEVMKQTGGNGADVVITALSAPSCHTEAQVIAAKMGRISLFGGIPGDGKGYLDSNLIHYKELSVFGSHATTIEKQKQIFQYVQSGKLNLEKYASRIVSLENIEDGFSAIRESSTMKVLVKP